MGRGTRLRDLRAARAVVRAVLPQHRVAPAGKWATAGPSAPAEDCGGGRVRVRTPPEHHGRCAASRGRVDGRRLGAATTPVRARVAAHPRSVRSGGGGVVAPCTRQHLGRCGGQAGPRPLRRRAATFACRCAASPRAPPPPSPPARCWRGRSGAAKSRAARKRASATCSSPRCRRSTRSSCRR